MLLLIVGLASSSCSDGVLAPAPEAIPSAPEPLAPPKAFVAPVSDVVVASAAVPIPATNTYARGAQPWTLVHTLAESGYYEVRTVGKVRLRRNEEAALTGCSAPGCQSPADVNGPAVAASSVAGAGIAGGELRTYITVTTGETPYSGDPGIPTEVTADSQLVVLLAAGSRRSLYVRRGGIQGVRSCVDACGGMLPGPTGWYLLDSEMKVEVNRVTPLQVAPNKPEFLPGEALNWTTVRHRRVQEHTSWFWTPEGGYRTQLSCSGTSCTYAPPGRGTMLVISYYYEGGDRIEVSASAAVTVRQPKLQVKCAPARLPQGNETNCVASVDLPVSTFAVQSWSYSGTAAPSPPPGDVKEWKFKPGEVATGTVTVTALVGNAPQTATAQIEVVCNFFKSITADSLLRSARAQTGLQNLWNASDPNNPNMFDRQERGGWLVSSGGDVEVVPFRDSPTDRCRLTLPWDQAAEIDSSLGR
ncbi:MAG: hypothetical protein ICV87_13715, partial [Gemmatimonadetes bacterium]|nr:hypothetical protein [Gemmatimonadota bacterium]